MQSSKIPLGEQGDSQGGTGPPLKSGRRRKPTNQTAAAVCPLTGGEANAYHDYVPHPELDCVNRTETQKPPLGLSDGF